MPTLYDFLDSGNGYKVRLTLRELGQRFVYREVNILRGETHEDWFLSKNPAGKIPVLELDDGVCLCESSAILFHLADGTALLPADRLLRTRTLQWMCFEQTNVDGVISRARFRRRYPDAVPTRPEEFEAWWAEGKRALAVLERQLDLGDYLVGNDFSIADICLFAYVHVAADGGFDTQPYPAIRAWCERIRSRPAYIERLRSGASLSELPAEIQMKFKAKLFRYPGPGGWTFAKVPEKYAPAATAPWGRTPVVAIIDERECKTSVWRDKKHGTLLPVSRAARGEKGDGDTVTVELRVDLGRTKR